MAIDVLLGHPGGSERWELLVTTASRFEADVIAARLRDEGLEVRLTVGIGAAYGVTLGELAAVDVYVPETHLADARLVLLAGDVDALLDEEHMPVRSQRRIRTVWRFAAVVLLAGASAPLLRLVL